jgi:hypothetical protein
MCGYSLDGGLDQVLDEGLAGVLAGAGAGLQDDRRADLGGGLITACTCSRLLTLKAGMP